MTTWIGIGLSIACLFAAEAALAAPQAGPRDAVEATVGRFMTIVQKGRPDAAMSADRLGEIRQIVREMFDFDEISRRALSRHWQTLQREEQTEFVTLFRDLLERAYLTQMEAAGGEKITFLTEEMEPGGSAIVRSKVTARQGFPSTTVCTYAMEAGASTMWSCRVLASLRATGHSSIA